MIASVTGLIVPIAAGAELSAPQPRLTVHSFRHTAGAISTIIGIVFVLPILTGLLPSSWGAHINAYLPEQAGTLITHTHEQSGDLLSPWQGFGILCIWTVLALAAAAYLLERRDA